VAFARVANGIQPPQRIVAGQTTKLTRTTHGVEYDHVRDEMILPAPQADAILIYRGGATGEEAPIRVIQGPKVGSLASQIAIDPVHGEIFMPGNAIKVFPTAANGDVAPIRVIEGPNTRIEGGTRGIAIDPVHNLIAMTSGATSGAQQEGSREETSPVKIVFFNRTDSGNVPPVGEIIIPNIPGGRAGRIHQLQFYPPRELIIAAIPGGDRSWENGFDPFIGVWSIHDRGVVPPRWKIRGKTAGLWRPRGVALMPRSREIVVADMRQNALVTFFFPEIF
jgi:hypothetical protein